MYMEQSVEGVPPPPPSAQRRGKGMSLSKSMEVHGFVMWIASFVCFGLYLAWAYIPEETLRSLGITYYPEKYWALAFPSYVCMLVLYYFFTFLCANLLITQPLHSYYTIRDKFSIMQTRGVRRLDPFAMDEIRDIPIEVVNKLLHHKGKH